MLFKNVDNEYFTLEEYKEKVKVNQTDKEGQLVFTYTSDKNKQDSFIQGAKNRGYDVLLMDGVLDNHFINTLEQKLEKVQLKRVDSETADKLIAKDEKIESVLSQAEQDSIKTIFEKAIDNKAMTISVEAMPTDEMPVVVTMSEFMRRMKDMAKMGGGGYSFMGNMPDSYNVTINGNHSIVQKIIKAENEEHKQRLAKQGI